jgi:hypothetical protein
MKLKKFQQFNEDIDMNMDMHQDIEHDMDRDNTSNYMFFENLKTLQRLVEELLTLDETEADEIIESGHDWINDHISVAKADVEQVYQFLMNNSEEDDMDMNDMDMHDDMHMHDMGDDNELDGIEPDMDEPEDFQSNPITDDETGEEL